MTGVTGGIIATEPASVPSPRPPDADNLDRLLQELAHRREAWASLDLPQRIAILDGLIRDLAPLLEEWVGLGLAAKDSMTDPYAAGFEWSGGPVVMVRVLRGLRGTLAKIQSGALPFPPEKFAVSPGGQTRVHVYPASFYERVTTPGLTAEVWFEAGASYERIVAGQRAAAAPAQGTTVLVLGAGNVSGLQVADALTKLFVDRAVVLLKVSPVTGYLLPLMRRGLRRLVDAGWLALVAGGREEGAYLCQHPMVDAIHMTGSDKTFEAIVFGDGPEGAVRKAGRTPLLAKPVTAELGNVAPAIVVPGPWSERDLDYQAENLASHLCDSGSYSCSRTRVIVQHAGWPARHRLLDRLRDILATIPPRAPFYPGSAELFGRFMAAHPEVTPQGAGDRLPWTLIPGLQPDAAEEICFTTESFCPVLAETALEAASAAEFIDRACTFANTRLWGTLTASLIVHPASLRDPDVAAAVDRAIERLRYGTVALNCLPGVAYAIGTLPWGGHPGSPPWDIQSGAGFANNTYLFRGVGKAVVRAPFRMRPKPIWFPSRRAAFAEVTRRVVNYESAPSLRRLAALTLAALR